MFKCNMYMAEFGFPALAAITDFDVYLCISRRAYHTCIRMCTSTCHPYIRVRFVCNSWVVSGRIFCFTLAWFLCAPGICVFVRSVEHTNKYERNMTSTWPVPLFWTFCLSHRLDPAAKGDAFCQNSYSLRDFEVFSACTDSSLLLLWPMEAFWNQSLTYHVFFHHCLSFPPCARTNIW